ncbi:RagB/SusD family nutrient uptake outer membrane protein [Pararcticibacter amylolyticus]|uniref:RagB/SusD family nutrient uptake outer membrane protein n=2 Tax=Pararcticibacter amylolyticus TaxID=2173175 RepID=A0A2U2PIJ0_9SPHI|nr:RagB/SusD family nutrient uptake outer membrane protein [Pararcticibacter amylolyticus]
MHPFNLAIKKLVMKIHHTHNNVSRLFLVPSLLILALISGCRKFVEIPPPNSELVTSSTFNNAAAATSAVTNIYTQMFQNTPESVVIAIQNGVLADELTTYSNSAMSSYFSFYRNAMTSAMSLTFGEWENAYSYIYQANAVIQGLEQYGGGLKTNVKNQLTGEAYFIRAFWHFYLTNAYGDAPIALTTDYKITSQLSRSPRLQVLQQVISDLTLAQSFLNSNYIDATDTATTTDRVRPNKAVASALLARAYLYKADYDKNDPSGYQAAVTAASSVIGNSAYKLCDNLSGENSVFLKNSTEAIWQLFTPLPANYNTNDGNAFILLGMPNDSGTEQGNTISPQLLGAFENDDKRKANWIGSITEEGETYYFPYKYKVQTGSAISEFTMVLRLAEQFLIRAEAKAELGDVTAVDDLNAVRRRAGLPNYAGARDKASLLTAIQHERQVELFTEWGHRWFDLNRAVHTASTINVNTVMGAPGNVSAAKGGTWSSDGHQQLYPIPLNEITVNPHITQNPGY